MGHTKKKVFTVEEYGSVDACLLAMSREGYTPVRRIEKPFFKEGANGVEVAGRMISFEGVLAKPEQ
ncbi:MAG TPA: NETI motif-containing protein [Sporolactobacillaceae bacterium]|nr:NETI motif-containing protein [Sporolactobacillaceae bacterium]